MTPKKFTKMKKPAREIPGLSGGQFLDLLKKNAAGPLRGVYFSPAFTRQAPKKEKE